MERCTVARMAGFTLWELLIALAIVGTVASLAAPAFNTLVLDSRRTTDVNAFVLAVQLARSEAAKRSRPVVLCKTADGLRCGGKEIRFDAGWMVFVNEDGARPPHRSALEPLLYAHQPVSEGTITGNRDVFEFRPLQRRSVNGTVTFCDRRGNAAARAVIVSYTGRPRVATVDPSGRPLVCAGFP